MTLIIIRLGLPLELIIPSYPIGAICAFYAFFGAIKTLPKEFGVMVLPFYERIIHTIILFILMFTILFLSVLENKVWAIIAGIILFSYSVWVLNRILSYRAKVSWKYESKSLNEAIRIVYTGVYNGFAPTIKTLQKCINFKLTIISSFVFVVFLYAFYLTHNRIVAILSKIIVIPWLLLFITTPIFVIVFIAFLVTRKAHLVKTFTSIYVSVWVGWALGKIPAVKYSECHGMEAAESISKVLEIYKKDNNIYPTELKDLVPKYLKENDLPYSFKRFKYQQVKNGESYYLQLFAAPTYIRLWDKQNKTWKK